MRVVLKIYEQWFVALTMKWRKKYNDSVTVKNKLITDYDRN